MIIVDGEMELSEGQTGFHGPSDFQSLSTVQRQHSHQDPIKIEGK